MPDNKDFKKQLAALKSGNLWSKAQEESKTATAYGSTVPDGKYYAELTNAELGESNSSGRLQIAWEYTINDGDNSGDIVRDYDGLDRQENIPWILRKLAKFGIDTDILEPEELPDLLEQLVEKRIECKITLKTNKSKKSGEASTYQNVYIDSVIGLSGANEDVLADERRRSLTNEPTRFGAGTQVEFVVGSRVMQGVISSRGVAEYTYNVRGGGSEHVIHADNMTML